MKFYILCRRVGDDDPSAWGPGWAKLEVVQSGLAGYEEATSKCRRYQQFYHPDVLQFTVVVGEYDGPGEY